MNKLTESLRDPSPQKRKKKKRESEIGDYKGWKVPEIEDSHA